MRDELSLRCGVGELNDGDDDGVDAAGDGAGVLTGTAGGFGAPAMGSGVFGDCEDGLGSGVFPHMESSWMKGWDSDAG